MKTHNFFHHGSRTFMIGLVTLVSSAQTYEMVDWNEICTSVPYSTDMSFSFKFCKKGLMCTNYPSRDGDFTARCRNCSYDLAQAGVDNCASCENQMYGGTLSWLECSGCSEGYELEWKAEEGRHICKAKSSPKPTVSATASPMATETPTVSATKPMTCPKTTVPVQSTFPASSTASTTVTVMTALNLTVLLIAYGLVLIPMILALIALVLLLKLRKRIIQLEEKEESEHEADMEPNNLISIRPTTPEVNFGLSDSGSTIWHLTSNQSPFHRDFEEQVD